MPPVYLHSGVNRPDLMALLAQEKAMGMVNAHVVREPRLQWAFRRFEQVPLFLDSGFRRKMNLFTYIRLIERYGSRFQWITSQDCLFDQRTSDQNYRRICGALPASLRSKILWVYQDGPLVELKARARDHGFVGIGGCVLRILREGLGATLRWLLQIGEILWSAGCQAHIFGIGNKPMLSRLCIEPWIRSLDSSKWLVAYRGNVLLLPSGGCVQVPELDRRECAVRNIRTIHSWMQPEGPSPDAPPALISADEGEGDQMQLAPIYFRSRDSRFERR